MKKVISLSSALIVMIIASLACSIDLGNQPQVPIVQQPPVQQEPQVVIITATPAPVTITPLPTYTPAPTYTPQPTYTPYPVDQNPTATAKENLDCKPYPTFDASYLDGIPSGRTVEIVGKTSVNSGWYLVKWSTYTCWVYSGFVVVTGDLSKVTEVIVVIPPKEDIAEMTITVKNNFPDKKLCRMALHKVGGGLLRWWEPGNGNWDPGETATFKFPLKNGSYDIYIYTCNGNLVDQENNFFLEDGGSYKTP